MEKIAEQLLLIIETTKTQLSKITEDDWDYKSEPNKWSKKEMLGHLIDSAANNHQRFVRLQFEDKPTIIYDQNKWVSVQNYTNVSVENIIGLFENYNKHLAYILSQISKDDYKNLCDIKKEQPVTLEWIASDYIRHIKHHLQQIIGESFSL